jgi:peptidoglycan/LPS O-acetylase OafA/YrhL
MITCARAPDQPHNEPRWSSPISIPSLTGIRGIAAAYVFLTHFQNVLAVYLERPEINANSFMYNGFRGVDLFFVLSGFILMHVHSRDFVRLRWPALRAFYILRFSRVYPLNAVVLFALLPIGLGMPNLVAWFRFNDGVDPQWHVHDFCAAGFMQELFLAQTWTILKLGEWNGPSWTLSAEVVGYALFPFVAQTLIRRRSPTACILSASCSLSLLTALLIAFGHANNNPTGSFGLVRLVFSFLTGMFLCRAFQLWHTRRWLVGTAITMISVLFIVLTLSFRQVNVLTIWGFSGLIWGLAYQQGPFNALAGSRMAMFMGRISFSFYLIHFIPLKLSLWLFETSTYRPSLTLRIVVLLALPLGCIAMATAMHRYVERPIQHLARRLLGRPSNVIRPTMMRSAASHAANRQQWQTGRPQ